jgi:hypothetical protein
MNSLTIHLQPDADGSAELTVDVRAAHYAGSGSAWFDTKVLSDFAAKLEKFPLDGADVPTLAGGYWNRDATELAQEHVHLSLRPLGNTGTLVMKVKTFAPTSNPDFGSIGLGLCCDLLIDYESLRKLATGMRDLLAERRTSAQIEVSLPV